MNRVLKPCEVTGKLGDFLSPLCLFIHWMSQFLISWSKTEQPEKIRHSKLELLHFHQAKSSLFPFQVLCADPARFTIWNLWNTGTGRISCSQYEMRTTIRKETVTSYLSFEHYTEVQIIIKSISEL